MRILAVDAGTGTQDILLLDTSGPVENSAKLVMPSATSIAAGRIRRATIARDPVVLSGVIQGGGPCHWALEDHLRAGLTAYATPEAAATFDDDLDNVRAMGVTIVSEDEARTTHGAHVRLRDLDLDAIRAALAAFDVTPEFDGFAVGCLDHGNSPPGYSDRLFRFNHLRRVVEADNDLRAFAYLPEELPHYLTRARTLMCTLEDSAPAVFLDTGPAAALGALQDPAVSSSDEQLVLNLGNMHALAFHLRGSQIISLYEHHTGEMTNEMIEDFTSRLPMGELRHEEVFDSKGHGVFYARLESVAGRPSEAVSGGPVQSIRNESVNSIRGEPKGPVRGEPNQSVRREPNESVRREPNRFLQREPDNSVRGEPVEPPGPAPFDRKSPLLAVTGPQRNRLRYSRLNTYFAAPHGDMMLSGCFGMLRAFAHRYPQHAAEIEHTLDASLG
jgi:uncharacterized protein (DUF1786 family)